MRLSLKICACKTLIFRPCLISRVLLVKGNSKRAHPVFVNIQRNTFHKEYYHADINYESHNGLSDIVFLLLSLSGGDGGFSRPHLLYRFLCNGYGTVYPEGLSGDGRFLPFQAIRLKRLAGLARAYLQSPPSLRPAYFRCSALGRFRCSCIIHQYEAARE